MQAIADAQKKAQDDAAWGRSEAAWQAYDALKEQRKTNQLLEQQAAQAEVDAHRRLLNEQSEALKQQTEQELHIYEQKLREKRDAFMEVWNAAHPSPTPTRNERVLEKWENR